MANTLILYSTTDGHTVDICKRLRSVIEQAGGTAELLDLIDRPTLEGREFDKIVIGASIRYGKHQPAVYEFIKTNRATLEAHPNAMFSVNASRRRTRRRQIRTSRNF